MKKRILLPLSLTFLFIGCAAQHAAPASSEISTETEAPDAFNSPVTSEGSASVLDAIGQPAEAEPENEQPPQCTGIWSTSEAEPVTLDAMLSTYYLCLYDDGSAVEYSGDTNGAFLFGSWWQDDTGTLTINLDQRYSHETYGHSVTAENATAVYTYHSETRAWSLVKYDANSEIPSLDPFYACNYMDMPAYTDLQEKFFLSQASNEYAHFTSIDYQLDCPYPSDLTSSPVSNPLLFTAAYIDPSTGQTLENFTITTLTLEQPTTPESQIQILTELNPAWNVISTDHGEDWVIVELTNGKINSYSKMLLREGDQKLL